VLLPKLQEYFTITDSSIALMSTASISSGVVAFSLMFCFGDQLDMKIMMCSSVVAEVALHVVSLLCGPTQFWLFVTARSCAAFCGALFQVSLNVTIGGMYKGLSLTRAFTFLMIVDTSFRIISQTVSSYFVTNSSLSWKASALVPSLLSLPLIVM
ncbi:hypothetical protein PFISCL1PPCAC_28001, partial [Pristionchus fissidentatus]